MFIAKAICFSSSYISFIFGLKERGIRFYIPAPCAVVFPNYVKAEFENSPDSADYFPIFQSDYNNIQNKIISLMPLRGGHSSNWSVPDAVERIAPLIIFNNGHSVTGRSGRQAQRGKGRSAERMADEANRPKIIYVVRAFEIILVVVNLLFFAAVLIFMPEGLWHKIMETLRH